MLKFLRDFYQVLTNHKVNLLKTNSKFNNCEKKRFNLQNSLLLKKKLFGESYNFYINMFV